MTKKMAAFLMALDMLVEDMEKSATQHRAEVDYQTASTNPLMAYDVGHMKATEQWKERLAHLAKQARREFE